MAELLDSVGVRGQTTRNLEEIAAYLRELLEEGPADDEAKLLTQVLDSIERSLSRSYATKTRDLPAA
jgi:DNA-binding phage protein